MKSFTVDNWPQRVSIIGLVTTKKHYLFLFLTLF